MGRTQDALQICGHQDCAEALMTSEMFLTVLEPLRHGCIPGNLFRVLFTGRDEQALEESPRF